MSSKLSPPYCSLGWSFVCWKHVGCRRKSQPDGYHRYPGWGSRIQLRPLRQADWQHDSGMMDGTWGQARGRRSTNSARGQRDPSGPHAHPRPHGSPKVTENSPTPEARPFMSKPCVPNLTSATLQVDRCRWTRPLGWQHERSRKRKERGLLWLGSSAIREFAGPTYITQIPPIVT